MQKYKCIEKQLLLLWLDPLKPLINKSCGYLWTLDVTVCVLCIVEGAGAGGKCSGRLDAIAMRCHGNQRQLLNIPTGAYGWVWVHSDLSQSLNAYRSRPSRFRARLMTVNYVIFAVFVVFILVFAYVLYRIEKYIKRLV